MLGSATEVSNQLKVDDWTFGLVVEQSVFDTRFNALIGMAYPEFAEPGVTPLFEALKNAG